MKNFEKIQKSSYDIMLKNSFNIKVNGYDYICYILNLDCNRKI
jgi:hypothetical protein